MQVEWNFILYAIEIKGKKNCSLFRPNEIVYGPTGGAEVIVLTAAKSNGCNILQVYIQRMFQWKGVKKLNFFEEMFVVVGNMQQAKENKIQNKQI